MLFPPVRLQEYIHNRQHHCRHHRRDEKPALRELAHAGKEIEKLTPRHTGGRDQGAAAEDPLPHQYRDRPRFLSRGNRRVHGVRIRVVAVPDVPLDVYRGRQVYLNVLRGYQRHIVERGRQPHRQLTDDPVGGQHLYVIVILERPLEQLDGVHVAVDRSVLLVRAHHNREIGQPRGRFLRRRADRVAPLRRRTGVHARRPRIGIVYIVIFRQEAVPVVDVPVIAQIRRLHHVLRRGHDLHEQRQRIGVLRNDRRIRHRRHHRVVVHSRRIRVVRIVGTQRIRLLVHPLDKRLHRPARRIGKHHRRIVCGIDEHRVQKLLHGHNLTRQQTDVVPRHLREHLCGDRHLLGQIVPQFLYRHDARHQLHRGGGIDPLIRADAVQDLVIFKIV